MRLQSGSRDADARKNTRRCGDRSLTVAALIGDLELLLVTTNVLIKTLLSCPERNFARLYTMVCEVLSGRCVSAQCHGSPSAGLQSLAWRRRLARWSVAYVNPASRASAISART